MAGKPLRLRTSSFYLTGLPGKGETARDGNTFRRLRARERSGERIERILAGRGDPEEIESKVRGLVALTRPTAEKKDGILRLRMGASSIG